MKVAKESWFILIFLLVAGVGGGTQACVPATDAPSANTPSVTGEKAAAEETAVVTAASQSALSQAAQITSTLVAETVPVSPSQKIVLEESMPMSSTVPTPSDPAAQAWIEQAKEDLAGRLNVPQEQIELVEYKTVVWPDGSLGCPQPGMAYVQVLQDGYLIRLRFKDQVYPYHGGGNRPPFLCERDDSGGKAAPPSSTSPDP